MKLDPMLVAVAVIALVATIRLVFARPRRWPLLVVLQLASCAATAWLLFAPEPAVDADSLVIVSGDAPAAPGVVRLGDPAAPDIATVLRTHRPASIELRGDGLSLRDREALAAWLDEHPLELRYTPVENTRGLIALDLPRAVAAGRLATARGRAMGLAGGKAQWRDASDTVLAETLLAEDGAFELATVMKAAGEFRGRIALFDAQDAEQASWPTVVDVTPARESRALVLGGAIHPELKYLRRFLVDAGYALRGRTVVSRTIAVNEAQAGFDAASLAEIDLVVLDDRSWAGLREGDRAALRAAVDDGLGLLLRLTASPSDRLREEWRAFGFSIQTADVPRDVTLRTARGLGTQPDGRANHDRLPLAVEATDAKVALRADDGAALALVRNQKQGRIAITWLVDGYRAALDGSPAQYGALWAPIVESIARPRDASKPIDAPAYAFAGERFVACGVGEDATWREGESDAALVANADGCAAIWPARAGVHAVRDGERSARVIVLDDAGSSAFRSTRDRAATLQFVSGPVSKPAVEAARVIPPYARFLAWLALAALCWWAERRARRLLPSS